MSETARVNLCNHLDKWIELTEDAAASGKLLLEVKARGNYAITLHDCGRHREAIAELTALLPRYRAYGLRPIIARPWPRCGARARSTGKKPTIRRASARRNANCASSSRA